jgi:hypothetical protein
MADRPRFLPSSVVYGPSSRPLDLPELFDYCSLVDREDNLWFGTAGGGVNQYDGRTWTSFTSSSPVFPTGGFFIF